MMNFARRLLVLMVTVLVVAAAHADTPTFQISQLYSNLDGSVQYIELTETSGMSDQNHFKDLTLTSTHNGVVKTFTFPNDLPTVQTAHATVVIATTPTIQGAPIVSATGGIAGASLSADFVIPERFLATDGGAVDFAGIDQFSYIQLPPGGTMGLYRDGSIARAALPKGTCPWAPPPFCPALRMGPTLVTAVEYYAAARDHYFISASATDIDALDSGTIPGWERTGKALAVAEVAVTNLGIEYTYYGSAVCRFYIPPEEGDSHFFSGSSAECAEVAQRFPEFVLESSSAFYVTLPNPANGDCPVMPGFIDGDIPLQPVFRLWNRRTDTNHRYTTSVDVRSEMIARGWVPEGYGPAGVAMCD
jgi:hypothetical protein